MRRLFFLGIVATAGALAGTACGEDDGDDGDDDDNGGSTGGTGGTQPNPMCTPGAGGACQNDDDCPVVASGMARASAQTCGLGCQQDPEPGSCAVSCIVEDTDISNECAVCYATLVGCASENCLAECSADPTSTACNACQVEAGCRAAFDSCSGLSTAP